MLKTIFKLIQSIRDSGVTILLIEQNANMALKIANRGFVLETGNIILEGHSKDLMSNSKVKKAYLGVA